MSNFTTELMSALFKGEGVEEIMRLELESAMNELLKVELTSFLDYEKHDPRGYNSGNSRNGFYTRQLKTRFGEISVEIPRDRNGEFKQQLIPSHQRSTQDLENMVIQMYRHGITTSEIAELIEKMYGAHYTPQTVSNMTKVVHDQVERFHKRPLNARYSVIYCDATVLSVRRDSVAKEALHIVLGITPDGQKEVIDYRLFPSESCENYREMFKDLKERGVQEVLLCVSDGLKGLKNVCLESFPQTRHQACWVHLQRNVSRLVRASDKRRVMQDVKLIYQATTLQEARQQLEVVLKKYMKVYPKVIQLLENNEESLFSFYDFPQEIHPSIYTTNLIEGLNKQLKRDTKRKEQYPNEDSLDRFVCMKFLDYNQRFYERIHKGFGVVTAELNQMFKSE